MKFLLFDKEERLITTLKDVISTKHTEEINRENIFEITTLEKLEKGQRLVYKDIYGYWHEFIIKGVEEVREDILTYEVFAESSFYETLGDYIDDKRPSGTANSALEVALQPTRWEVGQVDNLGTNKTNFYHISAKEAVQKVAEIWQGEIRTRVEIAGNKITGRYVDLFAQRGQDLGKRFTYTKDLESITKTIHRDDVITALYGYGKGEEIEDDEGNATGGFGRRINFSEINNGKAYVENNEARQIWGRNHNGQKVHVFGKVEFDDCEDKQELLDLTIAELKERSKVLVTYEAKIIDLKAFGFEHEGVELGDTVTVIDKEFTPELRVKARVVKIVRDLLEPENNEIILGNFIHTIADTWNRQEEYINNFRDKQGVWDRSNIISSDGSISTNYLDGAIDVLKTKLLATESGWYTDDHGNIIFENADKTSAMMLTGEGFMIASTKLPNGEYNWRSFGTGSGFTADEIVAGVLKGGKVKIDLENGTFLIGNDTEDYVLWFDGSSLRINLSGKSLEDKFEEIEDEIKDIELTPGPPGVPGKDGKDGAVTYTWIRYADDINGNGISNDPTGKKYIGFAYNKSTATESNNKSDYTWSLIKGDKGDTGVKGEDGKDGQTTYTWIKYSDNADGTGLYDTPKNSTKYIGIAVNKTTATESNNKSDYTWSMFKGEDGEQGPRGLQGLQGPKGNDGIKGADGKDGKSSYTHIAYATNANGGNFSTAHFSSATYIGMYVDTNPTSSSDYKKYNWSLIRGAKGDEGIQGPKGDDGKTPYFHTAWANNSTGTSGFSTTDSTNKLYIGTYTDFIQADSTDPSKYKWTKIKGDKGDKGEQGSQGIQGPQGPKGADGSPGQSQYIHIRYSANSNGSNMTTTPSSNTKYIGVANTTSSTAPTSASSYTWQKFVGEDGAKGDKGATGPQGIQGPKGSDGKPTYTWVKYADTPTSGMSDYPEDKKYIGLAFNKTTDTESSNYSDYEWSLMPQNIEISETNLILNSYGFVESEEYRITGYDMTIDWVTGEVWTVVIKGDINEGQQFGIWANGSTTRQVQLDNLGNGYHRASFTVREPTIGGQFPGEKVINVYNYPSVSAEMATIEWIKMVRGDHTSLSWAPSPDDVQEELDAKVEQGDFDDLEGDVDDIAAELKKKAEKSVLEQLLEDYENRNAQIEIDKETVESSLGELLKRVAKLDYELGENMALWSFIETKISMSEEGIYISNDDRSMGILIGTDRLSFIDKGKEVAHIEGQLMKINHGIFVESATIGNYKTEDIPGTNISVDVYVDQLLNVKN